MARTKSFDVDDVLDRAVDLFWINGFAATSMEDLVQHLGINRGSLYSTFGSKEQLYQRAQDRYVEVSVGRPRSVVVSQPVPLRQRLRDALTMASEDSDHRGCLLVNAATERNAINEECRSQSTDAMRQVEAVLLEAFETGVDELRPGTSPLQAVQTIFVAMQGLRVMATTTSTVDVTFVADLLLDQLLCDYPPQEQV